MHIWSTSDSYHYFFLTLALYLVSKLGLFSVLMQFFYSFSEQHITLRFCRILNAFSKVPPKPKIPSVQRYLKYFANQLGTQNTALIFLWIFRNLANKCLSYFFNSWWLDAEFIKYIQWRTKSYSRHMHTVMLLDSILSSCLHMRSNCTSVIILLGNCALALLRTKLV